MRRHTVPNLASVVFLTLAGLAVAGDTPEKIRIVVCAPGHPGSTGQAQETMDELSRAVERGAGWETGRVEAVYHESLDPGLEALRGSASVAIVPLPLFEQVGAELGLDPVAEVIPESGQRERWSLVARRGALAGASALSGWEIRGRAGYAPGFVRREILADWPELPQDVSIVFSSRVVGDLRRAAKGEPVAVLLDRAQTDALSGLPFADELEIVLGSRPLVYSYVCEIGQRLPDAARREIGGALLALHDSEPGRELLATMLLERFVALEDPGSTRTAAAGASSR